MTLGNCGNLPSFYAAAGAFEFRGVGDESVVDYREHSRDLHKLGVDLHLHLPWRLVGHNQFRPLGGNQIQRQKVDEMENALKLEIERLREALDEAVHLSGHYARLLNAYDGGRRIQFKDGREWMDRLAKVKGWADDPNGYEVEKL